MPLTSPQTETSFRWQVKDTMHHQSRAVGQDVSSLRRQRWLGFCEAQETYLERLINHDVPGLGGHVPHRG